MEVVTKYQKQWIVLFQNEDQFSKFGKLFNFKSVNVY